MCGGVAERRLLAYSEHMKTASAHPSRTSPLLLSVLLATVAALPACTTAAPMEITGRWATSDGTKSGTCATGLLQDWVSVAVYDTTQMTPELVAAQTYGCRDGGFTLPIELADLSWNPDSLKVEVIRRSGDAESPGAPVDFALAGPIPPSSDVGLITFPN